MQPIVAPDCRSRARRARARARAICRHAPPSAADACLAMCAMAIVRYLLFGRPLGSSEECHPHCPFCEWSAPDLAHAIAAEAAEPMPFLCVSSWVWVHRPARFALILPRASPTEQLLRFARGRQGLKAALAERKALRYRAGALATAYEWEDVEDTEKENEDEEL